MATTSLMAPELFRNYSHPSLPLRKVVISCRNVLSQVFLQLLVERTGPTVKTGQEGVQLSSGPGSVRNHSFSAEHLSLSCPVRDIASPPQLLSARTRSERSRKLRRRRGRMWTTGGRGYFDGRRCSWADSPPAGHINTMVIVPVGDRWWCAGGYSPCWGFGL